jgi:hypothetical protein
MVESFFLTQWAIVELYIFTTMALYLMIVGLDPGANPMYDR